MSNLHKVLWTSLNRVLLVCIPLVFGNGCVRSSFVESTYQDCLKGDQVIVNARLFCVYQEPVNSRPIEDMDTSVNPSRSSALPTCPEFAPYSYSYSYLTICSEDENPDDSLIEVVVAEWTEQTLDQSSTVLDQGPSLSLDLNPLVIPPSPEDLADL